MHLPNQKHPAEEMAPMTLEETGRILCKPDVRYSEFERAILFFGLQVETLSPKQPKVASYARLHAAMKILEYIENTHGSSESARLTERLALPEYENILDQMLAREGGWQSIARAWTRRSLAKDIDVRWDEARDAARIIDFSYRFAQLIKDDGRQGGVTMGRYFVSKTYKISDGTLRARWREYGKTAVCVYLLREVGLRPALLTSKKFVEQLLKQVADFDRLQRLFATYRDISKVLRFRGYKCDAVVIECLSKIKPKPELRDFSPTELALIKKYPN
jgi:hypothetical protein